MEEYSTSRRMRSHIIITLLVFWAIAQHYGTGFSIIALGPVQAIVPNWALFLALGVGIVQLHNHRAAVLGPIREWVGWVLVGENEE